jgi:hypothetical protein
VEVRWARVRSSSDNIVRVVSDIGRAEEVSPQPTVESTDSWRCRSLTAVARTT